ncbi:MAG: restriction endonuclease [Oscillospiraceae bacterium]|jgi:site-specific DNA-methyltransferase (adenine-specific)|nr:restriction endonuclease [Oscillospiraceae bacterium]
MDKQTLYYGDNIDVMRTHIPSESVDLCYIDPPFNSKRNYNQIYNNIGREDKAQSVAFVDTWEWNERAEREYGEICAGAGGVFTKKTSDLMTGLYQILGRGSLLSYLVSMTLRINEIYRVLKPTGSFYLHCDPTVSHYLKLVLDAVFCRRGGDFRNEIVWNYTGWNKKLKVGFERRHDVIFFYTKTKNATFNGYAEPWKSREEYVRKRKQKVRRDEDGNEYLLSDGGGGTRVRRYIAEAMEYGSPADDVWRIDKINNSSKERLGYPTQKPEALLERIIAASSNEGDTVLDAFCGCGTTVAVAQRLGRRWIGIDITYNSISLVLKRLTETFGEGITDNITVSGIPADMESARALARKKDDRLRKEFEKWAVLTYTDNMAMINDKAGKDYGIDGTARILSGKGIYADILFSVKSGKTGAGAVRDFRGAIERDNAAAGVFITLNAPTSDMKKEAASAGTYGNDFMKEFPKIRIVTVEEILKGARLDIKLAADAVRKAERAAAGNDGQLSLL